MWLKLLKTFELVTWVVLLIFSLGLIYNSILIILLDLGFKNYHPFFNPTINYIDKYSIYVPKYDPLSASDLLVALFGFLVGLKLIDVTVTNMQSCYYTLLSKKLAHRIKHVDEIIDDKDLYTNLEPHAKNGHPKSIEKMYLPSEKIDEDSTIDHGYSKYAESQIEIANEKIKQRLIEKNKQEEIENEKLALAQKTKEDELIKIKEKNDIEIAKKESKQNALQIPSGLSIAANHTSKKIGRLFDIFRSATHKVGEYANEQKEALVDKEAIEALEMNPIQKKKTLPPGMSNHEKEFLKHPSFIGLIRYSLGIKKKPHKSHED